jgi:phosphotransacetylase
LSAVETVSSKIPSTLDTVILSKMAERGQIRGGVVDGPLAMDNAVSLTSARTKGVVSAVAWRADVLVVPNVEAANILAKELVYAARAEGAGVVLGAKAPIVASVLMRRRRAVRRLADGRTTCRRHTGASQRSVTRARPPPAIPKAAVIQSRSA